MRRERNSLTAFFIRIFGNKSGSLQRAFFSGAVAVGLPLLHRKEWRTYHASCGAHY